MHINCLELLAATLAVKTFLKNRTRMSVLLRLDWSQIKGYANPPWSRSGLVQSTEGSGLHCSGGTGLEDTAMVPPTLTDADCSTTSDQSRSNDVEQRSRGISGRDIETKSFRRKLYTSLVLKSWRTKTNKFYDSLFGKWHSWCCARGSDPFSGPIKEVVDFLANLHNKGYQSLDSYRSAISWLHVGQHPLVTRLMKGVFNDRPPLPRYTCIWNVQGVLPHVSSWGSNDSLLTEQLSWKTAMLLALTRHSRSADLSHLSLQYKPEGVSFAPSSLAKQSRQGKPITECFSFLPT